MLKLNHKCGSQKQQKGQIAWVRFLIKFKDALRDLLGTNMGLKTEANNFLRGWTSLKYWTDHQSLTMGTSDGCPLRKIFRRLHVGEPFGPDWNHVASMLGSILCDLSVPSMVASWRAPAISSNSLGASGVGGWGAMPPSR